MSGVGDGSGHGPPVHGVSQFGAQVVPFAIANLTVTECAMIGSLAGSIVAVSMIGGMLGS